MDNDDISLSVEDLDDLKDLFDNVFQSGSIGKINNQNQSGSDESGSFDVSSNRVRGRKERSSKGFTQNYDDLQTLRAEYQRNKSEETKKQLEYKLKKLNLQEARRKLQENKVDIGNSNLDDSKANLYAQSELKKRRNQLQQKQQEHSSTILSDREQSHQQKLENYTKRKEILGQKKIVSELSGPMNNLIKSNRTYKEGREAGKDLRSYMAQIKQQASEGLLGQPISGVPHLDNISKNMMSQLPIGFDAPLPSTYDYIKENANYSSDTQPEVNGYAKNWMSNALGNSSGMRMNVPPGLLATGMNASSSALSKNGSSNLKSLSTSSNSNNTEIRWWIKMQDTLDDINENIKKLVDSSASKTKLPPAFYNRKANEEKSKDSGLLGALGPVAMMLGGLFAEKFGPVFGVIQHSADVINGFLKNSPNVDKVVKNVNDLSSRIPLENGKSTSMIGTAYNGIKGKLSKNPLNYSANISETGEVYSSRQIKLGNNVLNARKEHEYLSEHGTDEEKKLSFQRMEKAEKIYQNRYGNESLNNIYKDLSVPNEVPKEPGFLSSVAKHIPGSGILKKLGKAFNVGGQITGAIGLGIHGSQAYSAWNSGKKATAFGDGVSAAGDALGIASLRAGNPVASGLLYDTSVVADNAGTFIKGFDYKGKTGENNWDIFHKAKDINVAKSRRAGFDASAILAGMGAGAAVGGTAGAGFFGVGAIPGALAGAAVGGLGTIASEAMYNHFNPIEKSLLSENQSAIAGAKGTSKGGNDVKVSNAYSFTFNNPVIKSSEDVKKLINQAFQARDNVQKSSEVFSNNGTQSPAMNALQTFGMR